MSTIREDLEADLVQHGLWPKEAAEILDLVKSDTRELGVVLHRSMEAYPPQFKAVARLTRSKAKEWLKEHHPEHFALAMLETQA